MPNRICTRFKDDDGLDIGCHLVTKEYMLEAYADLVPWMKAPGLWLWGRNDNGGQLGNRNIVNQSSPVQTISSGTNWKQISLGYCHTAAIKTDGTLWLWGGNSCGQIGDNSYVSRSSPVQTVSAGTDWKQVSVGYCHSGAVKNDGTLWVWGGGLYGQRGDDARTPRPSPVQTITGGTNWKQVSLGYRHSAATKTDGTLWAWGANFYGKLGNDSVVHASSPVQTVSGGTNWKQVVAERNHTIATKTDGTLWLWGYGTYGRLGNNCIENRSSPVQTISGGTTWRQFSAGRRHTASIKTDGTLWIWGRGTYGRLGTGNNVDVSSPVQTVSGGTNWRQVDLGGFHSAAIKTDGSLWMWGFNQYGRLGDNTTNNRFSPVQTIVGGTDWRQVSLGIMHSAAIRDEGEY